MDTFKEKILKIEKIALLLVLFFLCNRGMILVILHQRLKTILVYITKEISTQYSYKLYESMESSLLSSFRKREILFPLMSFPIH
jgi:hypothetical protein